MKKAMSSLLFLLVFTSMFPFQLNAQDITGKWHGIIDFSGFSLRLDIEVAKKNDQYSAIAYSPDQGNSPIPVDDFSYSDGKMEFAITGLNVRYSGRMNIASSTIQGTFSQYNQSFPLVLGRQYIEAPKGSPT